MNRLTRMLGGLLLAGVLAACGGGGGSSGATPGSGTGNPGTGGGGPGSETSQVADVALFTDKTTINNSGTDKATVTVIAVDGNRNVVPGATVTITGDENSVVVPSGTTTDSRGVVSADVQIGSDKTNRDITLTVSVNGIMKRTSVRVSGSRLTLATPTPTPSPGQNVTVTTTLLDAAGNPIPNIDILLGGTIPALRDRTVTTNASGVATVTFAAPTTARVYTITASGGGILAPEYQIQVFAGGGVPPANIPGGVAPSLSASPNVLSVNTANSTANKATLRFLMVDAANRPVQNVRVRFDDVTVGRSANSFVTSGTDTLYTDTSGSVSAQYIAGQTPSPTNGVRLRACYSEVEFTSATDCPNSVDVRLTVAGQALAVSIGDDNLLQASAGTYVKRFAVTVADSAGRAVANAPVDISVDLTHYGKGAYIDPYLTPAGTPTSDSLGLTVVPLDPYAFYPSETTDPEALNERVWCRNEDLDRDGIVDNGENINDSEDSNGQPTLEPRKSDLLISYDDPSVTATDADGLLVIKVQYSQRFATWLAYKVRVTANVSGSQGTSERLFVTDALQADAANGSFRTPPYGVAGCREEN